MLFQGVMHRPKCHLTLVLEELPREAAAKLSRQTARRVSPTTPAWLQHRQRRAAREARVSAVVAQRRESAAAQETVAP